MPVVDNWSSGTPTIVGFVWAKILSITGPSNWTITLENLPPTFQCADQVPPADDNSVPVTGNCGGPVTVIHDPDVISNQSCPNRYTINRVYHATDNCGDSGSITQVIVVNDTTPPSISCPVLMTVTTDVGKCTASNVNLVTPSASDSCSGPLTLTNNAPTVFPKGTNLVVWTATDACGNSATCTQRVIVVDGQPPTISCPGNILANATDPGGAVITFAATAMDNCDSNLTVNCSPASGSEFAVGTTSVNCTVVDTAGNSNACSFTVTVVDPTIFSILSIAPQGNNVRLSWIMPLGHTGIVQGAGGAADGSYSSNFNDISTAIFMPGSGVVTTNYLDVCGMTNSPSWFYRIRLMP